MGLSRNNDYIDVNNTDIVQGIVSVGTTQIELKVAASQLAGRQSLRVYNKSNTTIYIGPTGVTTSTGEPLLKKQSMTMAVGDNLQIFAIAGSTSNDVVVWEVS